MALNIYYLLAIACLAFSALFGYLGANYESRRSGDEQLDKLSARFDELGEKIANLQSAPHRQEQVGQVSEEYKNLVRDYLSILPQKAQQLRVDSEKERFAQLQRSREIQTVTDFVVRTIAGLVAEFRREGVSINFEEMKFPSNAFSIEPYQLKLFVDASDYWSIHLVDREMGKIGLMFVRVMRDANGRELLTNDSVVFRWVGTDRYGFSLNDRISPEVRKNVFEGLSFTIRSLSTATSDLELFPVNLVKYEIARARARSD